MKKLLLAALAALIAFAAPVCAHGGGGGYVYIPIYIPAGPPIVPGADVGSYDRIHKVAILSAIGTKLELESWNFWAPKDGALDISSWQVDDKVASTLKKYLGGKFTFVDLPFDRTKLAAFRPTIWHAGQLTALLKSVPNTDVDAFLVVYPDTESGIQLQSGQFNQVVLWVRYVMELIDAHTYKTIAKSSSRYLVHEGAAPEFPGRVVGDEFKLDDTLKLPPEKIEKLHGLTSFILDVTLTETVRSLQFGVPLPPVGDHSLLPAPPVDRTQGVKTIAVYSAIGDRLQLHAPGGMLAKDTDVKIPIADWGLDADVETTIRGMLAKDYVVKSPPVDRAVLAGKWWTKKGDDAVVDVPPTPDVDAYLLVLKDERKIMSGLGLWHDGNWVRDWTYAGANYVVLLVDAHTQKPIIAHTAVMSSKSASAIPSNKVPNEVWPKGKKLDALPPGAAPVIREALTNVLRDSLAETLYRMGVRLEGNAVQIAPADTAQPPATPAAPETATPPPNAQTSATPPAGGSSR